MRVLAFHDPGDRLIDVTADNDVVTLRFTAEDLRGASYTATAKVFLPFPADEPPDGPVPVWFSCGYQLADGLAGRHLRRGRVVVTPCDPEPGEVFAHTNPLGRGPNTDFVLAHLVRSLPFVDPAGIVYAGGSAGGYAALLVAAEAFPAGAVAATVPVVNLAYQGVYWSTNGRRILADPPPDQPLLPQLLTALNDVNDGSVAAYGDDLGGPAWYAHSPVAHLARITCPVAAFFSTADFLVPIAQVGSDLAARTLAALPPGVTMDAKALSDHEEAGVRLLDVLGGQADVHVVGVPEGAAALELVDLTMTTPQTLVPVPAASRAGEQWLVAIVDEGPTGLGVTHTRHTIEPNFEPFVEHALAQGLGVEQLTPAKLDQLMDRYRGVEWLAPGFSHLDREASEAADIERGLRSYCGRSPAHAQRFLDLYAAAAPERRVLRDAGEFTRL